MEETLIDYRRMLTELIVIDEKSEDERVIISPLGYGNKTQAFLLDRLIEPLFLRKSILGES